MRSPLPLLSRAPRALQLLLAMTISFLVMLLINHFTKNGAAAMAAAPLMLGPLRGFGKTYDLLKSLMKPADADQPESVPWVLYDSQPYAAAGAATLSFFSGATAANNSDLTLSNFPTGVLQGGFYFEIHRVHVIIDSMPNTNASLAITGGANDVEILHKTARGVLTFTLKGKSYGPNKLAYFGRPGGPQVAINGFGTAAGGQMITVGETENNGGFPYLGNIIIPPITNFVGTMQFNSTAISAQTLITVGLMGILHRPVA